MWGNDFKGTEIRRKLLNFVSLTFKSYRNAVPYIEKTLGEIFQSSAGYVFAKVVRLNSKTKEKKRTISFNTKKKHICFSDLLDYDADDLARQLTLLEANLLQSVSICDFVGKSWLTESKKDSSPLVALSQHFNRVSLWVATAIVSCDSERRRHRMYRKFAKIAKVNFISLFFSNEKFLLDGQLLIYPINQCAIHTVRIAVKI